MFEIIGFLVAILFFGLALKIGLFFLRIIFGILGIVLMLAVFPVFLVPVIAILGPLLALLPIVIPLLIIGGIVFVIRAIF